MSKKSLIRCNNCYSLYECPHQLECDPTYDTSLLELKDLVLMEDELGEFSACSVCKTDDFLMTLEEDPNTPIPK